MKGDTQADIKRLIELNSDIEPYKDMPVDLSTIRKVTKELTLMPKSIALRLMDELPDMIDYFIDQRPDLGIDKHNIPKVTRLSRKTRVNTTDRE